MRDDEHSNVSVRDFGHGCVWLQHRDGEGGSFDAAEVQLVRNDPAQLEAYFWRNF